MFKQISSIGLTFGLILIGTVELTFANCTFPQTAGVNVCSPTSAPVSGPVTFTASAVGASGRVDHMELWVDSSKHGDYFTSQMSVAMSFPPGMHIATFIEVDSRGAFIRSSPTTIHSDRIESRS